MGLFRPVDGQVRFDRFTEENKPAPGRRTASSRRRPSGQLLPQSDNVFLIYKDGWHPAEVAQDNPTVEWQWSKRDATISFRNPRRNALFYLHVDGRPDIQGGQQVSLSVDDQVVDIDLAVEDLIDRLKGGKIYAPDKVQWALENFFQPEKLTLLREIALREVAESVDRAVAALARMRADEARHRASAIRLGAAELGIVHGRFEHANGFVIDGQRYGERMSVLPAMRERKPGRIVEDERRMAAASHRQRVEVRPTVGRTPVSKGGRGSRISAQSSSNL